MIDFTEAHPILYKNNEKNLPLPQKSQTLTFQTTNMVRFEVTEEYIELIKLLKVLQIAESGAMAKALVENEEVRRNGTVETRKRAKIRKGETIEVLGETIVTY